MTWATDFPSDPVHCWFRTDTRQWVTQEYPNDPCPNWQDHRYQRGKTPWLRFIHAFGQQTEINPFVSDGHRLLIETDGHDTTDGRHAYCETYVRDRESWGLTPVFRVFLAQKQGWARIECYDPELFQACQQALAYVEQSYIDEEENIDEEDYEAQ